MTSERSHCWKLFGIVPLLLVGCGSASKGSASAGGHDASTTGPDGSGGTLDASGHGDGGASDAATDSTMSAADAPPPSEGGPVKSTVSSWLGTNGDADLPYADITYLMKPFNTAAAQLDANGYPVAGATGTSSTDMGFELPTGMYNISYVGTGTLAVSGIGKLVGNWATVNGEQQAQVLITGTPGNFGNFLTLTVTNGASQTVTAIHVYLPGIAYDPPSPFNPQYLAALAPFRAIRFMGLMDTNNSALANWSDRPASSQFGQSSYGIPYEYVAELINETGKDGWINVPEQATSSFITSFASFMASNLDFTRINAARAAAGVTAPFQLIVENSNETWNGGFSAYMTFLTAANANASRYTGTYTGSFGPSWMTSNTSLMKVGQYEADRLVLIGQAFTTAFQGIGQASAIAPVLSGWALGAAYSDVGMTFIQANYGDPKSYVSYVALAPYLDTPDDGTSTETSTASLSTLFPALQGNIMANASVYSDFAKLGSQYGVTIAAYEGGQGLSGTKNETIKHLAQFDARMYQTYQQYFAFWRQSFPTTLFMHFTLAGTLGLPENIYQYGFWGSLPGTATDLSSCGMNLPTLMGTESVASEIQYCPKYQALVDVAP